MPRESILEADSKCQSPGVNLPGVFKVHKQVQLEQVSDTETSER